MAYTSVFDRLVGSLSSTERQEMLERVRTKSSVPERDTSLDVSEESVDVERAFRSMSFLRRLFVMIRTFFSGKTHADVVGEELLADLGATIRKESAGLVDVRAGLLLEAFHEELVRLRTSAIFFTDMVDRVWTGRRNAFLAFLLGLDLPDVQKRLIQETDPYRAIEDEPDLTDYQLKLKLHSAVLHILDLMPVEGRESLQRNARFLEGLRQLSMFRFGDLLGAFGDGASEKTAPFFSVRDPLTRLVPILDLIRTSPSARMIEALVLFTRDDELERGSREFEDKLVLTVQQAIHHLRVIWGVMDSLPLNDLVRFLNGDVNFRVKPSGGGEEYMALVKRFWRERTDLAFTRFQFSRHKQKALEEATQFTEGAAAHPIHGYPAAVPGGEGRHAASLGLVRAVHDGPFRRFMYAPLKTLLIDGEFYKDANRDEFTAAFDSLDAVSTSIQDLERRVSAKGDLGRTLAVIEKDDNSREERLRNRAAICSQVDKVASGIVQRTLDSLRAISDVIHGILYGEIGGRHDTLANLGTIGGRSHKSLMAQLDDAMNRATSCREGIGKVLDIENSIARRFRHDTDSLS